MQSERSESGRRLLRPEANATGQWKRAIITGILAGVIWGWFALIVNAVSGAFSLEERLIHNLITFATGGALLGLVAGVFLNLLHGRLPFKNIFLKAMFISTALWVILRIAGALLSYGRPHRYHPVAAQTFQGLILSVLLGCIIGFLWSTLEGILGNTKGNRA